MEAARLFIVEAVSEKFPMHYVMAYFDNMPRVQTVRMLFQPGYRPKANRLVISSAEHRVTKVIETDMIKGMIQVWPRNGA